MISIIHQNVYNPFIRTAALKCWNRIPETLGPLIPSIKSAIDDFLVTETMKKTLEPILNQIKDCVFDYAKLHLFNHHPPVIPSFEQSIPPIVSEPWDFAPITEGTDWIQVFIYGDGISAIVSIAMYSYWHIGRERTE